MPKISVHCIVSGRVQGVFFRANTQQQAQKLAVTGWVRNLVDGRVEVLISGEQACVLQLVAWLWHGPERACVTDVAVTEIEYQALPDFIVR